MKLAFSTCWNSRRHTCGRAMIEEILDLGFRDIELSHGIKSPLLEGVLAARERHNFTISSVHNFLPMPVEILADAPDCYEFSSHRASDRSRAVRLSRQTIDWAARLEAKFVVVHCGRIPLPLTEPLRDLVEEGEIFSKEYTRQKRKAVESRERAAEAYTQRVLECLIEIADYAGTKGVKIGIENREQYEAIPTERELVSFLRRLDSEHAGYWHDFGHAQIKQHLGLLDHAQWLNTASQHLLGCHLHDVRWPFRDHSAPFTGEVDYKTLTALLPDNCQMVLELSPRTDRAEIPKAVEKWNALFGR